MNALVVLFAEVSKIIYAYDGDGRELPPEKHVLDRMESTAFC